MNGREGPGGHPDHRRPAGGGGPAGQLVPRNRNAPRTTTAAGIGIPIAIILIWAFEVGTGTKVPAEVAGAFGAVCSFVLALLTKEAS